MHISDFTGNSLFSSSLSPAEIRKKAVSLQKIYLSDLKESFADKCLHFGVNCFLLSRENSETALERENEFIQKHVAVVQKTK